MLTPEDLKVAAARGAEALVAALSDPGVDLSDPATRAELLTLADCTDAVTEAAREAGVTTGQILRQAGLG